MYGVGVTSAIWVCGVLGGIICGVVLGNLKAHWEIRNLYWPAIGKVVIMMGCTLGMFLIQFVNLGLQGKGDFLFYFTDAAKAVYVFCFVDMTIKLIGWENLDGPCYSEAKFESILIRINNSSEGFGKISFKNHEDVKWFVLRGKISIIQYCIVSFGVLLVSIFLKFNTKDNLGFGNISPQFGFLWLCIFKICSALIELFYFVQMEMCLHQLDGIFDFKLKDKFRVVKYCLAITEIQPLIIGIISKYSNVFGGTSYSDEEKAVFLISFFYSVEILSFLLASVNTFDTDHYIIPSSKVEVSNIVTELSSIR